MIHRIGSRLETSWSQSQVRWGGILFVFGVVERVWLWLVYQPISYGDTGSYLRLAEVVSRLTLKGYDGTRVPGYPAFLAIVNLEPSLAWIAQMGIGLAISMMLFWIIWQTTGNAILGAVLGILYDLIPGQFLFEANLLAETLTAFWIIVSLTFYVALERKRGQFGKLTLALLLGVAVSAVGMFRPLFFPLTLWFLPFVWFVGKGSWKYRLVRLGIYSIGPLIIQGSWLIWINRNYRMVSPTTMAGYSLVQHTGEYFEYLPDDAASIRDTYLRFRDEQIAERGVQTNAIWEAIPAMSEATGLSFFALSRELQRLSVQLILEHPDLYLRNVIEGWIAFWKAPVYWQPEVIGSQFSRTLLNWLALLGRGLSVAANALFLLLSGVVLLNRQIREGLRLDRFTVIAAGMVWFISFVQTLVDHGDNPRFLVPLQMVLFYVVLRAAWFWFQERKTVRMGML